ncbi:YggS family pyridoxal phosphate-dependent enzyme [Methylophilaceae bacterium]|nr:YggS family pyridoxal phosphate-dependent enzyme [Methylophilaceae bacterium]
MLKIKKNIDLVRDEIKQNSHKTKKDIRLVAVSKGQSYIAIKSAFDAGQKIFGENYLQEALEKKKLLENLEIEWHFIGPIQSNKCKLISENFSWVQTVDRIKIVNKLNQYRHSKNPLNICIQVNISEENTKSGIGLNDVKQFAKLISNLKNLKLRGVMAIPSKTNEKQNLVSQYRLLKKLYEDLKITYSSVDTLSIGMSNDYLLAIENGANLVRIGTKIFGAR